MSQTDITIQGLAFAIADRYEAGHTLTDNEAVALNRVRAENIRNNMAKTVNEAKEATGKESPTAEDVDMKALQKAVDEYAAGYEFGVRTARTSGGDPIKRLAMEKARSIIKAAISKKGIAVSQVPAATISKLAADYLDANPKLLKEAAKEVEAAAEIDLADIEL